MEFCNKKLEHLPRLSWCICYKKGSQLVDVYHGSDIEVSEKFIFEGIWDDDFKKMNFDKSSIFMGTGCLIKNNKLILCTPCHTLAKIFVVRYENELFASNSLPFLLALSNIEIDKKYIFYCNDLRSIMVGLKKCSTSIPTLIKNKSINIYYFCNITINNNLSITKTEKPIIATFNNFTEYKMFIENSVIKIYNNSQDNERKIKYEPLTTISTGYDSPACSIFAKKIGCKEGVTFKTSRRYINDSNDSGIEIGKKIGLNVYQYDRKQYLKSHTMPEAEFFACGTLGEDVAMLPLENILKNRIFFTGFHGDKIWNKQNNKASKFIKRGDCSGCSMEEFRLRVGFIHVPIPFFGCANHYDIHKISNSEEMKPWTLNTDYDRPIPRRIIEEYGIDREDFGIEKKAITIVFMPDKLKNNMTKESYVDFTKYKETIPKNSKPLKVLKYKFLYNLSILNTKWNSIITKLFRKIGFKIHLNRIFNTTLKIGDTFYTFHWGIEKIKKRYEIKNDGGKP